MYFFMYLFFIIFTKKGILENHLNIRVLTYDRYDSFARLLTNLNNCNFENDEVNLEIFIDAINENLSHTEKMKNLANNFAWLHGNKTIYSNTVNQGLKAQWFHKFNWKVPLVILEDDIILSNEFYSLSKSSIQFIKKNNLTNILGITFQQMEVILKNTNCDFFSPKSCVYNNVPENTNFFLPQFGTWGSLVFKDKWDELIDYYENERKNSFNNIYCIPGSIVNKWYNTSETYMQYFMFIKGYFMMYFNTKTKIAHNFKEKGVHFSGKKIDMNYILYDKKVTKISLSYNYFFDQGFDRIEKYILPDSKILNMKKSEKCYISPRSNPKFIK